MLEKCLKDNIYVNETEFCDSTEQAIDVDFTLPDYCPDISRIFKCQAVPRISSKSVNGKTVTIDGSVGITLLYADKDGCFCSYEYPFPFSKNLELTQDVTGGNVFCRIRCEYINCRAVTGRKVDIHGAAGIFVRVFKRKCNEIVCDIDDSNIEVKRMVTPATIPMGYAEKYVALEEDIRLGDSQPAIRCLLRTNSSVCVRETKVINDKAVVKGEVTVCMLYSPEDGSVPQVVKTTLPFSQIVDVEGITESCECECKAEMTLLDVKPKSNSAGDMKCFSLDAKILLTCEAFCGNDITVLSDAFSRKYEAAIKRQTVSFEKLACNVNEKFVCKKTVALECSINSVIDLWCSVANYHTRFEEGNMLINGTLLASVIACDENNETVYCEKPIDFTYSFPFEGAGGNPHCDPDIEILSCGFTIASSDSLDLRIELGINAGIYEKNDLSLITDIVLDETRLVKRDNNGAMVIFYPDSEDTVWDIANKFGASVEEIQTLNGLEDVALDKGKMLLVPLS